MTRLYHTTSDAQTTQFGASLGTLLRPGDALFLRGDLGAGKSILARGIARALGVEGPMPSPTFTLLQPYDEATVPVYHFDLYRLSDIDEFYAAGLHEYIDADGVALIEWPVEGLEPLSLIEVTIERTETGECDRLIRLDLRQFDRAEQVTMKLIEWEAAQ